MSWGDGTGQPQGFLAAGIRDGAWLRGVEGRDHAWWVRTHVLPQPRPRGQRRVISRNITAVHQGLFETSLGPKPAAVSRMVSIDSGRGPR